MDKKSLTSQEKWVLEQLEKGEEANLKEQFSYDEADRQLSSAFLDALLTGEFKLHRRGVHISHAIIGEPIELDNAEITTHLLLHRFIFKEKVSFRDARCRGHFGISSSQFYQDVDFVRLYSERTIFLSESSFNESLNFSGSDIGGQFIADRTKFIGSGAEACFSTIKVGQSFFIRGAEFNGPVDFSAIKVSGTFHCGLFKNENEQAITTFHSSVNFIGADIAMQFWANEAKFLGQREKVTFNSIKVRDKAIFEGGEFHGPVDFAGAVIGGQFIANRAMFLGKNMKIEFNGINVGQDFYLRGAEFYGPVDFSRIKVLGSFHCLPLDINKEQIPTIFHNTANFGGAEIGAQFAAHNAKFLDSEAKIIFNSLKVFNDAIFNEAEFHGPVDFGHADIGGQFLANDANFHGRTGKVNFNSLNVRDNAFFKGAEFHGLVDFTNANIGRQFLAKEAKFFSEHYEAQFHGIKVGNHTFFNEAEFYGPVGFVGASISGQFIATRAKFLQEDAKVNFNDLIVAEDFIISETEFHGPVNFENANIYGQFFVYKSKFLANYQEAIFRNLKVHQDLLLSEAEFKCVANFGGASIGGQLKIDYAYFDILNFIKASISKDCIFNMSQIKNIMLNNVKIGQDLIINNSDINVIEAIDLEVKGNTRILETKLRYKSNFKNALLTNIYFYNVIWPSAKKRIDIRGMRYNLIEVSDSENWRKLLQLLDSSPFDPEAYNRLEDYYIKTGQKDRADAVFIAKNRQRLKLKAYPQTSISQNVILKISLFLIGLRRQPLKVILYPFIFLYLIGIISFYGNNLVIPKKLTSEHPIITYDYMNNDKTFIHKSEKEFNRYFYVLDLILPIDLDVASHYIPAPENYIGKYLVIILRISGWLIIAFIGIILSGLIKKITKSWTGD